MPRRKNVWANYIGIEGCNEDVILMLLPCDSTHPEYFHDLCFWSRHYYTRLLQLKLEHCLQLWGVYNSSKSDIFCVSLEKIEDTSILSFVILTRMAAKQ